MLLRRNLCAIVHGPQFVRDVAAADLAKDHTATLELIVQRSAPLIDASVTGRVGDLFGFTGT